MIPDAALWLTMLGMGAVTFAVRLLPIALADRVELPPLALRALRYVPTAVLSAIIFPELLIRHGALDISAGNPRLIAGSLAALVAWRTRSVVLTIAVGMLALWLLQSLGV